MGSSKFRELPELAEAPVDLLTRQRPKAVDAELFTAEAAQDRSVNDGAPQLLLVDMALLQIAAFFRHVADEAAGETVACARGIEDFLQQACRHHESHLTAKE